MSKYRIEADSMGEIEVPADAKYGAQTQRAINNFKISNQPLPHSFIQAIALIKHAAAYANAKLDLLAKNITDSIVNAATDIANGQHKQEFPIDVMQTGSGTSSNMNVNEVIANLCPKELAVNPNDHVNMGQSSNDVIPTAILLSAAIQVEHHLIPALTQLTQAIAAKQTKVEHIVKTGRTHLMDAMPITLGQELNTWRTQLQHGIARILDSKKRLLELPIGGTAVGTGINTHPNFAALVTEKLSALTKITFISSENKFEGISSQDAAAELSAQLKVIACSLMKISNDLRWMNSGPLAGLGEITLKALQPGSSIMPGKVNPVIPEAVAMAMAQVIGNDTTITIAAQSGNFQLNVMLPVIAVNLLESIELITNSCSHLVNTIKDFSVNEDVIAENLSKNPILITALNAKIGYALGAKIAKTAYKEKRPILAVAQEMTKLTQQELTDMLDPAKLTKGGIN